MSRLGKQPILIPDGVKVTTEGDLVTVEGKGVSLTKKFKNDVAIAIDGGTITLSPTETQNASKLWGTYAAHLRNLIQGVTEGFTKVLEIQGVGYRAEVKNSQIVLNVGFSHPVHLDIPQGIDVEIKKNSIILKSADKELLGQFAANIRKVKKPEPYKGKGIRYKDEFIIRKQGKKAV